MSEERQGRMSAYIPQLWCSVINQPLPYRGDYTSRAMASTYAKLLRCYLSHHTKDTKEYFGARSGCLGPGSWE